MRNILAFLFKLWIVFLYYIIVCPILYFILLIMYPFNKNRKVTFKNVFDSNFVDNEPNDIQNLKIGQKYYVYKSALDWLIDRKTWYIKK